MKKSFVLNRRRFCQISGGALLTAWCAPSLLAKDQARHLYLKNSTTGETFKGTYWDKGYDARALKKINEIFKCRRTGQIRRIDKKLLDVLFLTAQYIKSKSPIEIISGYRVPLRDDHPFLKKHTKDVREDPHSLGRAVDIKIEGVAPERIVKAAKLAGVSRIGKISSAGAVHIDTLLPLKNW